MTLKDEVKVLLIKSGFTLTSLVKALNEKYSRNDSVQNLNGKLTRETLKYTEAKEISEILGYEIKWIPKDNISKE